MSETRRFPGFFREGVFLRAPFPGQKSPFRAPISPCASFAAVLR
jgi:hypothetical protein